MLKKNFVLAAMLLLPLACQDFREEYHEPVEIRFSPAVTPATRSSYGLFPEDGSFGVWGFTLPFDKSWTADAAEAKVIMDGEKVFLHADGWRTTEPRIWDYKSRTTFIAWAPYEQEVTFDHEKGVCISSFDVLSDSPDPMFSYPVMDQCEPAVGGTTGIPFHHALAFVEMRAFSDTDETVSITLKSASMDGLMSSGSFQSLPEPRWTPDGTGTEFVFCSNEVGLTHDSTTLGETRRMLPQTADIQAELVCDVYDKEGGLTASGLRLSTNRLHVTWIPGRKYVYTVRISASEAILNVETFN